MKWILYIIFSIGLLQNLSAQLPDEMAARILASDFFRNKTETSKRNGGDLQLLHVGRGGFIYVPADGEGFVWISGKEGEPVVVGYGWGTDVWGASLPPVLAGVMDAMPETFISTEKKTKITEPVAPLLSSVWVQDAPFNGKCPYYRYENGALSSRPCLVGCVATATSEVMRYYAHPETLLDTLHGWKTEHYELPDVMPGTSIDWVNILDRYDNGYTDAEAEAIQDLSLFCGMACQMNYGIWASGSSIYKLIEPLQRVFGYRYVNLYDRSLYSLGGWDGVLSHELKRGVPLVYCGFNIQFSGHAFVLDGMDGHGFYHIRWGDSNGYFDGYYDIDILEITDRREESPEIGRQMGFFCNQSALAFHPDSIGMCANDTLGYKADDVTLDELTFKRKPDTNGLVTAEVKMTNHSADTIRYTLLAFVADSLEVTDWTDVDDVAITAVNLYPGETSIFDLYCDFKRSGLHYFGLTGDQVHLLYMEPLQVDEGGDYRLNVGEGETLQVGMDDVTLRLRVSNESVEGWCGDLVTYTLYPEGDTHYISHWTLLDLAPGEVMADTLHFGGLEPGTDYLLRVRCPWDVIYTYEFSTLSADCIKSVVADKHKECQLYNLQGVRLACVSSVELKHVLEKLPIGIYIVVRYDGKVEKVYNH